MKVICTNKRAGFEYIILEKYEAGIKLTGTEIKSVRLGKCNINDAYVIIKNNKPFILKDPFIYFMYMSTLLLPSDTPGEAIRSNYRWL